MSNENGVFSVSDLENFWRFGEVERGWFPNLTECVKSYCAALTDFRPEMAAAFNGKMWSEIYVLAGISPGIIEQLEY